MNKVLYNKRSWLNKEDSTSTGNVVAMVYKDDYEVTTACLSISDCYNSARLHKTGDDSMEDFINKMKVLNNDIESFINFLEINKNNL